MDFNKMGLIVKRDDGSEEVNYDDPAFPSYIYDGWIKPKVTWERVPHFHRDIEMCCVTQGETAYSINGKTLILHEGDTIFINSNQIHYMMSTTEEVARYVIFIIDPIVLCSSVPVEMNAIRPIIDNPDLTYLRYRDINEHTEKMYKLMTSLPDIRRDPFEITVKFFQIWDIILKHSRTLGMYDKEETTDAHMLAFKAMMHYISDHYREGLTLDDIASSASISRSLCNNIFHKYVNESPVNYVMHFRARKVAEYLRSTSLNMSDIAEMTGFRGVSYMSETFKRFFVMSPREFRKRWSNQGHISPEDMEK
ncbi:MAG: AraC family transcriptional regulator [Clostridiales bacterium]|nr:AraC family transcriptional regulator [Clostridiales bacterium]